MSWIYALGRIASPGEPSDLRWLYAILTIVALLGLTMTATCQLPGPIPAVTTAGTPLTFQQLNVNVNPGITGNIWYQVTGSTQATPIPSMGITQGDSWVVLVGPQYTQGYALSSPQRSWMVNSGINFNYTCHIRGAMPGIQLGYIGTQFVDRYGVLFQIWEEFLVIL